MSLFTDLREVFTAYAQRIKSLAATDNEIKADLGNEVGLLKWTSGKYIPTNIDPVDATDVKTNSSWKYMLLDVAPGEQYVLKNVRGGTAPKAWCIADSSGNVLNVADQTSYDEHTLTIPANGAYLIIHANNSSSDAECYKVGNNLAYRISSIENGGSGLSDTAKDALLTCLRHIAWVGDDWRAYYETLANALKNGEEVWIWNIGKNVQKFNGSCDVNANGQLYIAQTLAARRRCYPTNKGLYPFLISEEESEYYPIPIPTEANKLTISWAPTTQYFNCTVCGYEGNGLYSRDGGKSWTTGGIIEIALNGQGDENRVLIMNSKYDSAGTSYPTEPSSVSIAFSISTES